jgi:hypothetical protein
MIKGINKQIIEIKCTNDEYFDKVLLFVRADKAGTPDTVLQKGADNFCGRFLSTYRGKKYRRKLLALSAKTKVIALTAAATGVCALIMYMIYLMM